MAVAVAMAEPESNPLAVAVASCGGMPEFQRRLPCSVARCCCCCGRSQISDKAHCQTVTRARATQNQTWATGRGQRASMWQVHFPSSSVHLPATTFANASLHKLRSRISRSRWLLGTLNAPLLSFVCHGSDSNCRALEQCLKYIYIWSVYISNQHNKKCSPSIDNCNCTRTEESIAAN